VTLEEILKTFNAPISEDQAWALIYQTSRMYKARLQEPGCRLRDLRLPLHPHQLNVQKDGSCNVTARGLFPVLINSRIVSHKPQPQLALTSSLPHTRMTHIGSWEFPNQKFSLPRGTFYPGVQA
ncbi:AGAP008102-PA, partial [Anopheles gambiae str. PEST]